MRIRRSLAAVSLALLALGGLFLAVTHMRLPPAWAEAPAKPVTKPSTLPKPHLSNDDVVDAPLDRPPVPFIDGRIAPGEYAGAGKVTFPGFDGAVEVFFKEDGAYLYVAFDVPARETTLNVVNLFFDTDLDGDDQIDENDYMLQIQDNGVTLEYTATQGGPWTQVSQTGWTGAHWINPTGGGWQSEYRIEYAKLGLTAGTFQELGLAASTNAYYWPTIAYLTDPQNWGHLVSSSDWGSFYWKPGPWEDYAPSGMPDFDEQQAGWMGYDGPVAMANSLWWFDAKFETPGHPPTTHVSDTYRLVTAYGDWDDHAITNVVPFVNDLATYFNTNTSCPGTHIADIYTGTLRYLQDHGLWDDYHATLVISPTFEWVADEVMRSEDVVLLLGFYERIDPTPGDPGDEYWMRRGGHYVNVAGVDPGGAIALSDPLFDYAEAGWRPGRVLSGTLLTHYPPHPIFDPTIHNDAGNVSHDIYVITPTNSPGGIWGPDKYGYYPAGEGWTLDERIFAHFGENPHPRIPMEGIYEDGVIQVEVEFALAVSPYTWKASGAWMAEGEDPVQGTWIPWLDYAPNGVPDFDQKQKMAESPAGWGVVGPVGWQWTHGGPAAAANSLWWFDSKFEPFPILPPTLNDSYPLVQPYGPWDDHDLNNVGGSGMPGTGGLVDDLAWYFDTDGIRTGSAHLGTNIQDMYHGLITYTLDRGLRQGYVITMVERPEFWWIAEEVERSEDVVLLLGFYADVGDGIYERAGGHYVTVPGVDKQGGLIAFSDPYFNRAEIRWPFAVPGGWPWWMGRVADGVLIPHPPYAAHTPYVHNDAGNLSHDVYYVTPTDSPGGVWGPAHYVSSTDEITNFFSVNAGWMGPGGVIPGWPAQTEVEGAVAVSPVADVWITKTVTPTVVGPGDWVTFTIDFRNLGHEARDVVIADAIPAGLTQVTYTTSFPGMGHTGTYRWWLGTLPWQSGGQIVVTGRVDPDYAWAPGETMVTNTAVISTATREQYQLPAYPNEAVAGFTVQAVDVGVEKHVQPLSLIPGDWLTYTLVFTNHTPLTATNVVITDALHGWLVGDTVAAWTSYGGLVGSVGRYTWLLGDVPGGGWGLITVTAQVSPTLVGGGPLPNTAYIGTTSSDTHAANDASTVTNTVEFYDVALAPPTSRVTGEPGRTVTHTLTLTNTGTLSDSYALTIAVLGQTWNTYVPAQVGPLNGGQTTTVDVQVEIPIGGVDDGDWSRTIFTATSQMDGRQWAGAVLTTTVAVTRGVALSPTTDGAWGAAGTTLTYTLRVTNTGNVSDTFALSHAKPVSWSVSYAPAGPLSLLPGGSTAVDVGVGIPAGEIPGITRGITVTATSQGDPTETARAVLTTLVPYRFFLPLAMRSYGTP